MGMRSDMAMRARIWIQNGPKKSGLPGGDRTATCIFRRAAGKVKSGSVNMAGPSRVGLWVWLADNGHQNPAKPVGLCDQSGGIRNGPPRREMIEIDTDEH